MKHFTNIWFFFKLINDFSLNTNNKLFIIKKATYNQLALANKIVINNTNVFLLIIICHMHNNEQV